MVERVQVSPPRVSGWQRAMVGLGVLWTLLAAAYLSFHLLHPLFVAIYLAFVVLAAAPAAATIPAAFRTAEAIVVPLLVVAGLLTLAAGGLLFVPAALPLLLALLPMSGRWPAAVLAAVGALLVLGAYLPYADLTRRPDCFQVTVPERQVTLTAGLAESIGSGAESVSVGSPRAGPGSGILVGHREALTPAQQAALEQRLRAVFPRATDVRHCTSRWEDGPIRPVPSPPPR
ncbi:hypothetical protein [Jidongwangia harbinensis]|uniref:hypothetical protein n=1 Tax=Jidongwangia harbinensis TaxID=2878561 RepID=UPI001CD922F7|nr:hypothetical protein [Jidongwangia harbinensis]MCA2212018.1 hypothetical protein [Jidongwangia harbinensis]